METVTTSPSKIDLSSITKWKVEPDEKGEPHYSYCTALDDTWTPAKLGDFTLPTGETVQYGPGLSMLFDMSASLHNQLIDIMEEHGSNV